MRLTSGITTLLFLLLMGGCGGSSSAGGPAPEPAYDPAPDQVVASRISDLPGVEEARTRFNGTFPESTYAVRLRLTDDADVDDVVRRTIEILRTGRFRADITLAAAQADRQVYSESLGWKELDKTYGPQPSQPADG